MGRPSASALFNHCDLRKVGSSTEAGSIRRVSPAPSWTGTRRRIWRRISIGTVMFSPTGRSSTPSHRGAAPPDTLSEMSKLGLGTSLIGSCDCSESAAIQGYAAFDDRFLPSTDQFLPAELSL